MGFSQDLMCQRVYVKFNDLEQLNGVLGQRVSDRIWELKDQDKLPYSTRPCDKTKFDFLIDINVVLVEMRGVREIKTITDLNYLEGLKNLSKTYTLQDRKGWQYIQSDFKRFHVDPAGPAMENLATYIQNEWETIGVVNDRGEVGIPNGKGRNYRNFDDRISVGELASSLGDDGHNLNKVFRDISKRGGPEEALIERRTKSKLATTVNASTFLYAHFKLPSFAPKICIAKAANDILHAPGGLIKQAFAEVDVYPTKGRRVEADPYPTPVFRKGLGYLVVTAAQKYIKY